MRRAIASVGALTAAVSILAAPAATGPKLPGISFRVFAKTVIPLSDVTWTGTSFLYATENLGQILSGPPEGLPLAPFVSLTPEHEEYRCASSPHGHGFPASVVYCHAPRGTIYRLNADGSTSVFANLPESGQSDGAIAFDTTGAFGYALLAATGGSQSNGGRIYSVRADGGVHLVGPYPGPGGADGIEFAPRSFGSASNELLIAIDRLKPGQPGALLTMNSRGRVRALVHVPEGINPIVAVGRGAAPRGAAQPGLYVSDTKSTNVFFAPAESLRAFVGGVIVGSESLAHFWVVRPSGKGFQAVPLRTNFARAVWNLEGADYIA